MRRLSNRSRTALCLLAALVAAGPGCVSRNVENIGSEEADSIPPPPEPVDPRVRGEAEAAELPGLHGTLHAAAGTAVPEGVVFVIVRVAGREGGAPLAVKQLPGDLPASFQVTEADSMMPGTPLVGDLDVIARLDQDGNAFSRQEGDLEGRVGPVQVGATVEIVLAPVEVEGDDPSSGGPSSR